MIFMYRTKINQRPPKNGGGSYTSHEVDYQSTKYCCKLMDKFVMEDIIHFDSFTAFVKLAGSYQANFCPSCGEKIELKEIEKIRRYCIIEKELVEREIEHWQEEIVDVED